MHIEYEYFMQHITKIKIKNINRHISQKFMITIVVHLLFASCVSFPLDHYTRAEN